MLLSVVYPFLEIRALDTDLERAAQVPIMPSRKELAPIWMESTFRPPSVVPKATAASFVGGWSLVGLIKVGTQAFAILLQDQSGERMYVGPTPNQDGYSVESVHFDQDPSKETVTVRQNKQTMVLHYSPSILEELKKRYQAAEETSMIPNSTP